MEIPSKLRSIAAASKKILLAESSNTVDQLLELVLALCKSSEYGGSGTIVASNFVLMVNCFYDLVGTMQLETVLETHSQVKRADGVDLVITMVERVQRVKFEAIAHAFSTKGDVTSCPVCKNAVAACVTTDMFTEVPLLICLIMLLCFSIYYRS